MRSSRTVSPRSAAPTGGMRSAMMAITAARMIAVPVAESQSNL
jgi:hypothetical protein